MKLHLGHYDYYRRQKQQDVPAIWDSAQLINPHLLLCGKSGTGKSHQLRHLMRQAGQDHALERIHVFDMHGDLDVPGSSIVEFSGATRYGYNPLVLDTDLASGGVRRQTSFLIGVLGQTARKLMDRQEACLRNLVTDLYALNGLYEDKPETWLRQEITDRYRKELWDQRNFQALRDYYPTLEDLIGFAERKLKAMYGGFDGHDAGARAVSALEEMNRAAQRMKQTAAKFHKGKTGPDQHELTKQFESSKQKFLERAKEYVEGLDSGREFDDLIKYDSREVIKSVIDRLKNLKATGIFNASPPPFDPHAKIWVYRLHKLSTEEKVIFANLRAQVLFRQRLLGGLQDEVREVIVADEAHLLFNTDPDNIFNKIAKEARKFGLALWGASQSPSEFPELILTTVGTKILLGIDRFYWKASCTKLGITEAVLQFIEPKRTLALYMDREGSLQNQFVGVQLT